MPSYLFSKQALCSFTLLGTNAEQPQLEFTVSMVNSTPIVQTYLRLGTDHEVIPVMMNGAEYSADTSD